MLARSASPHWEQKLLESITYISFRFSVGKSWVQKRNRDWRDLHGFFTQRVTSFTECISASNSWCEKCGLCCFCDHRFNYMPVGSDSIGLLLVARRGNSHKHRLRHVYVSFNRAGSQEISKVINFHLQLYRRFSALKMETGSPKSRQYSPLQHSAITQKQD
jgi:hypothetical protein